MKTILLSLISILGLSACTSGNSASNTASGLSTQEAKAEIKAFAGCYKVGFNFAETFPIQSDYKVKPPKISGATELVVVDYESENEVHLQHILVIGRGGKQQALKHWRQEWVYQPNKILDYTNLNQWQLREATAKERDGAWLQRVTQVDDTPRYECSARWVATGHDKIWECEAWTPLPRREYTTRNDYQILERRNRQRLTSTGWIHEQDNVKIRLDNGKQTKLTQERGENTYSKIADSECALAQTWWTERSNQWKSIRQAWNEVREEHPKLALNFKDAEGDLWPKLFALDDEAARAKWPEPKIKTDAKALIETYVKK